MVSNTLFSIQVRIISGDHKGHLAFIPRITLDSAEEDFPFILSQHQFPLCLGFAITINKSQGQSPYTVGLNLTTPVFTHGQLYVALSCATSAHCVKVSFPENVYHMKTTNIVYPEVFNS